MKTCPSCSGELASSDRVCKTCGAAVGPSEDPTRRIVSGSGEDQETMALPDKPRRSSRPPNSSGSLDGSRFLPGQMIADRYRVVSLIGRGGMGEVYRADDISLGQTVALKFLPERLLDDTDLLEKLRREVRLARTISHPNVGRVFDIGEADGHQFLTMEYIDGEELGSLIRRIGRLPSDKAAEISRQICAGLSAAHKRGVIHRDLKPANIMIDAEGSARILDFGLAAVDGDEADPKRAGTPAYMSPEQIDGRELTPKSDIYSLGLVIYEIFTGKRAFDAPSLTELLSLRSSQSQPSLPSSHVKSLDPAVERVILRCLETDPEDRPASALAVAAALPGGDPLAAALALGELPSPEVVAGAPKRGALSSAKAITYLLLFVCFMVADITIQSKIRDFRRYGPEQSPEALIQRARWIASRFGNSEPPSDWGTGIDFDESVLNFINRSEGNDQPHDRLQKNRPSPLLFFYRQSGRPMIPLASGGRIEWGDPPWGEPPSGSPETLGMKLDMHGNLLEYYTTPPRNDTAQSAEVDWAAAFDAAGLRKSDFTLTDPLWVPTYAFDQRFEWTGSYPDDPGSSLRVSGSSFQGRIISFRIIDQFVTPDPKLPAIPPEYGFVMTLVILSALVAVACVLAFRNIRSGMGDKRGALRLGCFIGSAELLSELLYMHHVASGFEIYMVIRVIGNCLAAGSGVWLFYIAFEPFIRRRWPDAMISWTRLLDGRVRDPMVGRDLLFGFAAGSVVFLGAILGDVTTYLSGHVPGIQNPERLGSFKLYLGGILFGIIYSVMFAGALFFALSVLRALLRRDWLVILVLLPLLNIPNAISYQMSLLDNLIGIVLSVILLMFIIRNGLLALIGLMITGMLMNSVPPTIHFSEWYGWPLYTLVFLLAVACYSCKTSLGGQKVLRSGFLES